MALTKTLLYPFLLLLQVTFSTSKLLDTITINQTIKDGNFIISNNNTFVLGFFSPPTSTYRYLGIWFYKVPEQTVVWVANRNNPIDGSSGVLSLNQYGNLVLYADHRQKIPVWSTIVSVEPKAGFDIQAQLLDSGNWVLFYSSGIVWQSFDYPTNTMLPGMKFGLDRKTGLDRFLTSWKSPNDPGSGNFSLRLNPSGSPQLFLYRGGNYYWRSFPWPWKKIANVYNYSFFNKEEEIIFTYNNSDPSLTIRMMVDEAGFIKWLAWHGIEGKWKEFWSAPKYRCDWYGVCGANSICDPNNVNTFDCACLPGFEPRYPRDWNLRDGSGGCVRKRLESSSVCGNGEGFVKVKHVKVPDSAAAVWLKTSTTLLDCEQECLRNCSCSAYAMIPAGGSAKGSVCLTWYGELFDIINIMDYSGYDMYLRVDAFQLAEEAMKSNSFLKTKGMLVVTAVSVISAWLVIIIVVSFWIWKRRKIRTRKNRMSKRIFDSSIGSNFYEDTLEENKLRGSSSQPEFLFFELNAVLEATKNFSPANMLGQGGFGRVYKGQLSNGQEIAVKRMSENSRQGTKEFRNEVLLIAKLQHRNLVKLIGCCIHKKEQMLIYEYLPNKSLDSFIFDQTRRSFLNWEKRFNIIIGIARGILYLHQDSRLKIIHRDLKSSNILLDGEMNPKISDFGMARIFKCDQIQDKTKRVVGTYGYMSPEYAVFGKFSIKSDVFSFGVIILEIVSGKRSSGYQEDLSLSLIGHVWELWKEDKTAEIIDSSLKESYNCNEALRCIQIALLCVQEDAMDRPTMSQVVLMVSSQIALPLPKQPAFIFRTSSTPNSTAMERSSCSVNEFSVTTVATR